MEPISSSIWRRARRKATRSVGAVRVARDEHQRCLPGIMRGYARQPSMASAVNHTIRLPCWRKLGSYAHRGFVGQARRTVFFSAEEGEMPDDDLTRPIALDALRSGVPAHDLPIRVEHGDGIIRQCLDQ